MLSAATRTRSCSSRSGRLARRVLQVEQAKAVCRRCSVTDECLQWALESGQDAGVWGGMSEEERRAVKRRGGLRVCALTPPESHHTLFAPAGFSPPGAFCIRHSP